LYVTCVQVAVRIARRILCYVDAGAELKRGERFGFIRFGSRVDVYLPLDAQVRASIGDKVYAAESVLAWVKTPNSKPKEGQDRKSTRLNSSHEWISYAG